MRLSRGALGGHIVEPPIARCVISIRQKEPGRAGPMRGDTPRLCFSIVADDGASMDETRKPLLIVVTGRPGSGKTTLTRKLATAVRCPAICRDEIKEGFVNTTGVAGKGGDDIAREIYEVFFETVELLLRRRITLVAEAAFQHKVWAPKLEPLRAIARIRIIICEIDADLAGARRIARGLSDPVRSRFHDDPVLEAHHEGRELYVGEYDPPHLDVATLAVDTSTGYRPGIDAILSFACS
jgi:predicted kinase